MGTWVDYEGFPFLSVTMGSFSALLLCFLSASVIATLFLAPDSRIWVACYWILVKVILLFDLLADCTVLWGSVCCNKSFGYCWDSQALMADGHLEQPSLSHWGRDVDVRLAVESCVLESRFFELFNGLRFDWANPFDLKRDASVFDVNKIRVSWIIHHYGLIAPFERAGLLYLLAICSIWAHSASTHNRLGSW